MSRADMVVRLDGNRVDLDAAVPTTLDSRSPGGWPADRSRICVVVAAVMAAHPPRPGLVSHWPVCAAGRTDGLGLGLVLWLRLALCLDVQRRSDSWLGRLQDRVAVRPCEVRPGLTFRAKSGSSWGMSRPGPLVRLGAHRLERGGDELGVPLRLRWRDLRQFVQKRIGLSGGERFQVPVGVPASEDSVGLGGLQPHRRSALPTARGRILDTALHRDGHPRRPEGADRLPKPRRQLVVRLDSSRSRILNSRAR